MLYNVHIWLLISVLYLLRESVAQIIFKKTNKKHIESKTTIRVI